MDRKTELQAKAARGPLSTPEAIELATLNADTARVPTHRTSLTNYEAAKPVPAAPGSHETSLTNYLNIDKTPPAVKSTPAAIPAVAATAKPAALATGPVTTAPAVAAEKTFGDKLKNIFRSIADVAEATGKGYAGITSPTRLEKEYEAKLQQAEKTLIGRLEAERAAREEAADLRRLAKEQEFQAKQNALNRLALASAKAGASEASLIPE